MTHQQDQQRKCDQTAQDLVREELEGIETVGQGVQQASPMPYGIEAPRRDPHLAPELADGIGDRAARHGPRLEDQALAGRDGVGGVVEVVGHAAGNGRLYI